MRHRGCIWESFRRRGFSFKSPFFRFFYFLCGRCRSLILSHAANFEFKSKGNGSQLGICIFQVNMAVIHSEIRAGKEGEKEREGRRLGDRYALLDKLCESVEISIFGEGRMRFCRVAFNFDYFQINKGFSNELRTNPENPSLQAMTHAKTDKATNDFSPCPKNCGLWFHLFRRSKR